MKGETPQGHDPNVLGVVGFKIPQHTSKESNAREG
jgi:hypothetical protein